MIEKKHNLQALKSGLAKIESIKMNLLIIFLSFIFLTLPLQAKSTIETNDVKHLTISAILGYTFGYGLEQYLQENKNPKSDLFKVTVSTSLALSIGIAKEVYDSTQPNNSFSTRDVATDFTGSLLGALLSNYVHRENKNFTFLVTPKQPTQISFIYHF